MSRGVPEYQTGTGLFLCEPLAPQLVLRLIQYPLSILSEFGTALGRDTQCNEHVQNNPPIALTILFAVAMRDLGNCRPFNSMRIREFWSPDQNFSLLASLTTFSTTLGREQELSVY